MEFFNVSGNGEVHGQAETRGRTNQISDVRHQRHLTSVVS